MPEIDDGDGRSREDDDGRTSGEGGILDDVTVVDLSTFVTGGFASLMLANQGAEVIKIEQPGIGDGSRHSGPPFVDTEDYTGPGRSASEKGESPYFWTVNYDKRSVELDLKSPAGLAALYDLVETADVFLQNFRPGTADRLRVGYEDIRGVKEDIVYCSISAFGEAGPWSHRPGYDLLVQGSSGIMSVTGPEDGDPVKVGVPVTDLITAMWAAFGVVCGLLRRAQTSRGDYIELGMHDATLPWLTKQASTALAGDETRRLGTRDPLHAPYQAFPTADGHLIVGCPTQKLFRELCEAIDRPDLLADPRFASNGDRVTHQDALAAELTAEFEQRTTEEWVESLGEAHGIPVGPVLSVREALQNEHTAARGMLTSVDHPAVGEIPVVEHPLTFAGATSGFETAPPLLGEDTEAVFREIGYDEEDLARLRETGAIHTGE